MQNLGIKAIKAVVVGLGKQSCKHANAIKGLGGDVVIGIDPDSNARLNFSDQFSTGVYESLDVIDDMDQINVAVLCTPVNTRLTAIRKLLECGVRQFVIEKPLCLSEIECLEYISLETSYGAKFFVNYTYRLSLPYYHLHKLNLVSNLDIDYGMFYIGGRGSHRAWKHQKAYGGGAYNEMAVHMIDLARFLFGDFLESKTISKDLVRPSRFIDNIKVDVDAEDLVVVSNVHLGRKSFVLADFLSPHFSNRVQLSSQKNQIDCVIGQSLAEYTTDFNKIDGFGADSYKRLYNLIGVGQTSILHRPSDTLALLQKVSYDA